MAKWKLVGPGWYGPNNTKGGESWELWLDNDSTKLTVESYEMSEGRENWNCYIEKNNITVCLEAFPRNKKEAFMMLEKFMGVEITK